jgi:hypothetical protein
MARYEKNMVSNDLMSDVDECVDEKNSLEEDPTT